MSKQINTDGAIDLVIAILKRAVMDIKSKGYAQGTMYSAVTFLNGEDCKFYCECLGLDYIKIINQIRGWNKCQM
ncbi:hypothetical protein G8T71_10545 [Clostridium botulinum C/D]|uniref:hypothetical protein n=1 Tax=Clostridium botulinum TaxID=1491 RepID=UPI001E5830AA|nr:hypothetical protein [Clostridium botulinum]MCD3211793.1 hypothetical protein [Clostridium botulinum C/D]